MTPGDPLSTSSQPLASMHRRQVHRDPWPDFAAFEPDRYAPALRQRSAAQWMHRAREEQGSVYEFSTLLRVLCEARIPVEIQGALARIITDEVRHTELCARMARTVLPEGSPPDREDLFAWPPPRTPWQTPPSGDAGGDAGEPEPRLRWAAEAVLTSCCIGETLSKPLFEAVATVTTDPLCEAVLRQILRDEHLHAAFGWETLALLWDRLSADARAWLQRRLARRLGGFERSCARGLPVERFAGREVVIEPGDPAQPNLAHLSREHYAGIFYATLESEIFPRFHDIGLDPRRAWAERG